MTTVYEIINPSDKYTLLADEHTVACAAVLIVGDGWYGLRVYQKDDSLIMPIMPAPEWITENVASGTTLKQFIEDKWESVADCLDSFVIGDRNEYEASRRVAHPHLNPDFDAKWHEKRRSSMNDIGKQAKAIAKKIRKLYGGEA